MATWEVRYVGKTTTKFSDVVDGAAVCFVECDKSQDVIDVHFVFNALDKGSREIKPSIV